MLTSQEIIARYYVGYYNRAPDPAGFEFWIDAYERGVSTLDIANFFADQVETRALYPYFANPDSSTPEAFITSIYQNLFNRDPDDAGLTFWTSALTSGAVNTGQMIEEIIAGATTDPDFSVVQNKVAASIYWEDQANNFGDFTYTAAAAASASSILDVVTDNDATIVLAQTQTNSFFATAFDDKSGADNGVVDNGYPDDKVTIADQGPISEFVTDTADRSSEAKSSARAEDVLDLTGFRADSRFSGIDGQGVTVVVIDTGIDLNHPAFGPDLDGNGVADRITYARDFSGEGDGTADDIQSHGSHVSSIVGSSASGYVGVAPAVNIVALQALDNTGSGSSQSIEASLQWVVENAQAFNIVAVNMSLGVDVNVNRLETHPIYGDELRVLQDQFGIVTIAAAGNGYIDYQVEGVSYLSADPNTISVGAVGGTLQTGDDIASFSQRSNDIPTIFAPGAEIIAAVPGGGTGTKSGTSMAAPQVAGMVALAQQLATQELGRLLTADEITTLLSQSADTFRDDESPDDRVVNTGVEYQRVDMLAFGEAILSLRDNTGPTPPPPPPSDEDTIPDSTATNAVLSVGATANSEIDFNGDLDYFRIDLSPGTYQFTLNGAATNSGTLGDPVLALMSGSGGYITNNDDGGAGLNALLEYTVTTEGPHYLVASGYGSGRGTYEIGATRLGGPQDAAGDTPNTAAALTIGQSLSGELEFGADRDWFAVNLIAGQRYVFELDGGTLSDPMLFLHDASGALVAGDDDGGSGLNARLEFTANRTDVFFISAEAYSATMTGTYTLESAQAAAITDDFGNNVATQGQLQANGGSVTGSLELAGDEDWFRVDVQANTTYEFSLDGASGQGGLRDPLLALYDSSGQLIGSDDDGGSGLNSLIVYNAFTDHTIFLAADGYGGSATGAYTLASFVASQTNQDVPGDTSSTSVLAANQSIPGELEQAGDADWYAVNVTAGATYTFTLSSAGASPIRDPYLVLFDGDGNLITFDDDSGGGLNSALTYTAGSNGRVFISAEAFDLQTDAGTYEIALSVDSPETSDTPADLTTTSFLQAGSAITDVIDMPGDVDLHILDVEQGTTYFIAMDGATNTALSDPFLSLFDAAGTFLTFDDDSGGDLNALIVYTADVSGRVYVGAEAYSSTSDAGVYVIDVATAPAAPARVVGQSDMTDIDLMM
ncbi:S8 family serine peptidase [Marivita sp. S0852]|uniref:S8 family serine peptidase n=1 Tax=Marivita sp. S0852 TaxID=3373893 RepID=UPI003981A6CF